jgi:hypothetical protein
MFVIRRIERIERRPLALGQEQRMGKIRSETFRTQPETRVEFFIFSAITH